MVDAVMPWAFGGTRIALDHSLTQLSSAHRIRMTKLRLGVHTSENDATFINLTDHDRTLYLLR